jgi:hypothetical protein
VTLDYGHEVAGYPLFYVSSASAEVEVEVKYSEQFNGILAPLSDGPYPFAISLSNTYRVEPSKSLVQASSMLFYSNKA